MTAQDLAQLNEYMNQVSDDAPASNPNFAPVVPVLDAVEEFEKERSIFWKKSQTASPEEISRLERPMNAAAVALAQLIIDALNEGAQISFTREVE